MSKQKQVGFLATGEELVSGEFQDTNTGFFAHAFARNNIHPGNRVLVGDELTDIARGFSFLRQHHAAIVTIGGLGPTSDDRTRQALAQALDQKLVFNSTAWEWIVNYLHSLGKTAKDSHKQQAFFPEKAQLLPNPQGTAAGCYFTRDDQDIFMLPGPAYECRPMLSTILNILKERAYTDPIYQRSWFLLGVSESEIAEQLEKHVTEISARIGYRIQLPYLEIKLFSKTAQDLEHIGRQFDVILKPHTVSYHNQPASHQLKDYLQHHNLTMTIEDNATFGALEALFATPESKPFIHFFRKPPSTPMALAVRIEGLTEYWGRESSQTAAFTITMITEAQQFHIHRTIGNKDKQTLITAKEWICWELLNWLQKHCAV